MHLRTPFKVSLLAAAIALTGCGSDSSGGSDEPRVGDGGTGGEVGTPVSGFTVSAKGGSSTLGTGGSGGRVYIEKYNSGTALNLQKEGTIDTAYALPSHEVNLGSNPVTVSEAVTVYRVHDEDESTRVLPPAGTLYMLDDDMEDYGPDESSELNVYRLYKSDGLTSLGAKETQVTGLLIEEGGALILPNVHSDSDITLYFRNDVQNNGLLTTAKQPGYSYRLGLELYAAAYYGAGNIDVRGDDNEYHGQEGGSVGVFAHTITNSGQVITRGAKDGSEGNGGGDAGHIGLAANVFLENKGDLIATGGSSTSYEGGVAGDVNLFAVELYNSGDIYADSGDGRNGSSYSSSSVDVVLAAMRNLVNTGNISATGSDAHGEGYYRAGKGGDIELNLVPSFEAVSLEKMLVNSGDLNANGGSTKDEAISYAGRGGNINIVAGDYYLVEGDEPNEDEASALSTTFSVTGNLSVNGGDTLLADDGSEANAGNGGYIYIIGYDQSTSTTASKLVGYSQIDVSGGNGMSGNTAGSIYALSGDMRENRNDGNVPALSGPLNNAIDFVLNGGSSLADVVEVGEEEQRGSGRNGGYTSLKVENGFAYLQPGELTLTNTGAIAANGGRSFTDVATAAAAGGTVNVLAPHAVNFTASVDVNGGSDERDATSADAAGHEGSNAGGLFVISQYDAATVDATVNANGGEGDREGGHGGIVSVMAKTAITANGTYALSGGNALADEGDTIDSVGGDAGSVFLMSANYNSALNATVTAAAGTGDDAGESHVVIIDADCKSDFCDVEDMAYMGPR